LKTIFHKRSVEIFLEHGVGCFVKWGFFMVDAYLVLIAPWSC
jgi:hypothetical protein